VAFDLVQFLNACYTLSEYPEEILVFQGKGRNLVVKLKRDEQDMLAGKQGRAKQRAMEILVQYAEALGAERFIDTNNVHLFIGFYPYPEMVTSKDADALVAKFLLDTDEKIIIDYVPTFNTTHIWAIDLEQWPVMGAPRELHDLMERVRQYCIRTGISLTATCTPYQVGNIPSRGETCAWTESSAVPFCNAVLGARTNTEGAHSAFASALTGKVPLWGFHLDENRLGTHLIRVELALDTVFDWNLLGYYAGEMAQLAVPIYDLKVAQIPTLSMLKALNAAGASSGGIQMYHIVGVTPEAPNLKAALGRKRPKAVLSYGKRERRKTYENLNSADKEEVDLINLGCPHYSLEQLRQVARLLQGQKVHGNVNLWIWTAHQIKDLADRNGFTGIISRAGGHLLTDTCPLNTNLFPRGTRVVATDAAKHAHYAPAIAGVKTWFGTMEECIDCAVTGRWRGKLK
jgi:predicted aconitase